MCFLRPVENSGVNVRTQFWCDFENVLGEWVLVAVVGDDGVSRISPAAAGGCTGISSPQDSGANQIPWSEKDQILI